jgi:glycosyltransferase involved in cell wall biosynthesis
MKILWIKTDFLHPTTGGGQIRTLAMLQRLHRDHEVHYVAFDNAESPEGRERASEYSTRAYPVPHVVPDKETPAFIPQLIGGLTSSLPVAVTRFRSPAMKSQIAELTSRIRFDAIVCDFLFPAPNVPDLSQAVLFQHNVEAVIWKRRTDHAPTPLHRWYIGLQYKRMLAYEKEVCRRVRRVIAVSLADAATFKHDYSVKDVRSVQTGVDLDYFRPPPNPPARKADLLFLGSMDWMPNVDGIKWFVSDVLPLIHAKRPQTTLALVGRKPTAEILALARRDSRIVVSGTVPDVRPWLHGSTVSIVPLRIGGGTRLKIYEAVAARVPVVSTTIGAEGLAATNGVHIRLEDSPERLAACCLELLDNESERRRLSEAAYDLVASKYSWDAVTAEFAQLLVTG